MSASEAAINPDVAIIGAGIIGLSCAWELAKRGATVTLYDKTWPPRGASWAAAGMLAPAYEAGADKETHPRLFDLCKQSAEQWPHFAAELQAVSGVEIGYDARPSIAVATSPSHMQRLTNLSLQLSQRNAPHRHLTADQTLEVEPVLGEKIHGALCLETDGQVDNRAVIKSLMIACEASGVRRAQEHPNCNINLETTGWQATGNRPVKGQLLSLSPVENGPAHVINHDDLYIVPKRDRIIVGATSEPGISDTYTDMDATEALRRRAIEIVPSLANADILERWAGIRPASADGAPVFGNPRRNRYLATGHYRNGILLAPITAKIMADMILDDEVSDLAAAFSPDRFATAV